MEEETVLNNLKSLKEILLDEEKLVTYISLSKDLCVHVNDAKYLLTRVVEDIKKADPELKLNINYIISGLSNENNAFTTVCTENELETVQKTLRVICFKHIYSVCKGLPIHKIDNAALVAVNKLEDFSLCTGLISSHYCAKRTTDEISHLKSSSQVIVDDPITSNSIKKDTKNSNNRDSHPNKSVTKLHVTKSEPIIKSEAASPKKDLSSISTKTTNGKTKPKSIAGFFNKANGTSNAKITKTNSIHQEKIEQNKHESTEKSASLFNGNKKEVKQKSVEVEPKIESMDVDIDVCEPIVTIKKEPKSSTKNKKSNSISQIKKNSKVDKKRKRVLHVSDSESDQDDPFAEETAAKQESDDEIPPTPTVNTVKITSGILNPKKRRKMVDKTYTDEEGYILTRKEEVYESCSDDEEELNADVKKNIEKVVSSNKEVISPKEIKAKSSKKKISPPQKGKQATLENFFKKR